MGMPTFDESVKSLREHLVDRRKDLQMGGMPVAGRRFICGWIEVLKTFVESWEF